MKNIRAMKTKLLILLFVIPFFCNSQSIRLNYLCESVVQKITGASNFYYGFGYEQNLGSNIAVSLDYNRGYNISEEPGYNTLSYTENNDYISFNYAVSAPWTEFSYQSKYFISGVDEGSFY